MAARIGVIVPTLNCAATLDWTLMALKNQKDCTVRTIVLDGGSADGTLDVCGRWDVEVVPEPPGNIFRALNKGMRMLDTEWCAYVNGDDVVFQDSYARLLRCGDAERADIVYGHCDYVDVTGRFLYSLKAVPVAMLASLFLQSGVMGFAQPAGIFRASVYRELNGFNEEYRLIGDYDFYSRAILAGKRFVRMPGRSVAAFRLHSNQLTNRERENMLFETKAFMHRQGGKKRMASWPALLGWRLLNIRNYAIRLLRA